MERGSSTHAGVKAGLLLAILATPAFAQPDPNDPNGYPNAVRGFADASRPSTLGEDYVTGDFRHRFGFKSSLDPLGDGCDLARSKA